jgi:geranylgeranyl diphosphate synthase type II
VFGDPARTGKSTTSDLRSRKQTPLLAHARTTAEWERIAPYVGRELTTGELAEARALLMASGSRRFVEELAAAHAAAARSILDELGLPADLLATVSLAPRVPVMKRNGVAA